MNYQQHRLTGSLILILLVGSLLTTNAAAQQWRSVPDRLQRSAGVQMNGDWVYATGQATVTNIRQDKAYELARKKARLRALQWLRLGGPCQHLIKTWPQKYQAALPEILLPQLSSAHIKNVQFIRQWEQEEAVFSTVAAPRRALSHLECPFADVFSLIAHYLDQSPVSLNGLTFCLRYAPRYSDLGFRAQSRAGVFFQQQGAPALAACFKNNNAWKSSVSPLLHQYHLNWAAQRVQQARQQYEKDGQANPITTIDSVLSRVPSYSPAYLLLGQYLLEKKNQPQLAQAAACQAMQDGSCFSAALKLNVRCLDRLNSDEAQIYQYLLNKSEKTSVPGYPASLANLLKLSEIPEIAGLVYNSAGCAISGSDQKPDALYQKALNRFQKADSDAAVRQVLELLLQAINRQPASASTHNLAGACLRHLGHPLAALPFLWQAVRLQPDYDLALTNLGLCCHKLGQKKSAAWYLNHPAVVQSNNQWVQKTTQAFTNQKL